MSGRLTSTPESASCSLSPGKKLPELALEAAGGQGPAVVCFLNNEDHPDRRTERGRLSNVPARDSLSVKQMITSPRIEDFSEALKLFRVVFVDVTAVDPASCPEVNFAKSPFVVVIGPEGKCCKVFGPGLPTKQEVLDAMRTALKPKMDLEKYLVRESTLVKAHVKHDSLLGSLATYQKNLAQAQITSPGSVPQLEKSISKLQEEEARQAADLAAQEAAVQVLLDGAGLKRY